GPRSRGAGSRCLGPHLPPDARRRSRPPRSRPRRCGARTANAGDCVLCGGIGAITGTGVWPIRPVSSREVCGSCADPGDLASVLSETQKTEANLLGGHRSGIRLFCLFQALLCLADQWKMGDKIWRFRMPESSNETSNISSNMKRLPDIAI